MIERLPTPLRRILDWQRRRFFREEEWHVDGRATLYDFTVTIEGEADNRLPLLMTLPKLGFNRAFVGRIRDGRIAIKHRTRPWLWLIGPGSYYFTGRLRQQPDGSVVLTGGYKLRPTLAIMYYVYLTLGFAFLGLSILAAFGGTAAWAAMEGISPVILLAGLKMLAVSGGYLALGWGHITLEKWLDGRNRNAVMALLTKAVGKV